MSIILTRRRFSMAASSLLAAGVLAPAGLATGAIAAEDPMAATLQQIERRITARLGVAILDTQTGRQWSHRGDERFAMCSTFKAIASAAVLARVDAGEEDLSRRIKISADDIIDHAPAAEKRIGGFMTMRELCAAAVTLSDNTAANLILKSLGGPEGQTRFFRSIGDETTRLDRWEPELNEAQPGDPRDTTTPAAMAKTLQTLITGDVLTPQSRQQLSAWMIANTTGGGKLRAGLPRDWVVGDKTGSGRLGTANDIAVIWPPARKPVFIAVYITETKASMDDRNAALAEIARTMVTALQG
ncbi:class A beta-lactamase [Rhizobium sp. CG5]|uniref:class A beta-lactamase n=1 Tax=Rhizobium sp. CG5 TaxID=2726076 RepID=UPI0020336823|nr:class A beta-lactamase [Rhizobium sp. CG5]MCM2473708.1 class A beta-lactamase [Rhizobium sp. CG5]